MPTRILVPLDGSPFSESALPTAVHIARRTGARLHIVQVHESPAGLLRDDGGAMYDTRWDGAVRAQEEEYLRAVAHRCMEHAGVAPTVELLDGAVPAALAAYVADVGIDLIVMTTHGRGGISRAWVGSVADAIVRRGVVPVLLVRPRVEQIEWNSVPTLSHVLIPLDGSELSEGIIESAVALGRITDARYTLLRVVLPVPFVAGANLPAATIFTEHGAAESQALADAYLHDVASRLRASGLRVDTATLVHNMPAVAILDYAATHAIDSIAMATHGRGGWSRIALGSVADRVMRGTQLPMLLYRAPSERAADERDLATAEVHA